MNIKIILKLMENDRFRELYDEAKGYEKQANLTQLVNRSKGYLFNLDDYLEENKKIN